MNESVEFPDEAEVFERFHGGSASALKSGAVDPAKIHFWQTFASSPDPESFDQSQTSRPEEIQLGDCQTLVLEFT